MTDNIQGGSDAEPNSTPAPGNGGSRQGKVVFGNTEVGRGGVPEGRQGQEFQGQAETEIEKVDLDRIVASSGRLLDHVRRIMAEEREIYIAARQRIIVHAANEAARLTEAFNARMAQFQLVETKLEVLENAAEGDR
jgi:hypothetical protein